MASRYYRYKNGEEVMIRADLERNVRYYMRSGTWADERYSALTWHQFRMLGQNVHIEGKRNGRYYIREDYGSDYWTDDMFEAPNECVCTSLL